MTRQGSTAYDCIMMFKLLLLGQWYSLSDREKEVKELNSQLESLGLSINTAKWAIIDATLIESAGRHENKSFNPDISYGKDNDARWIKKGNKSHYGYKVFTSVDDHHGFIQTVHIKSVEVYEAYRLKTILEDVDCRHVLADKAYDLAANKAILKEKDI